MVAAAVPLQVYDVTSRPTVANHDQFFWSVDLKSRKVSSSRLGGFELSVHARLIWLELTAVAVRLLGEAGVFVAGLTVMPVWLPVMLPAAVSVAVSDWLPAVLSVALKLCIPLSVFVNV